MTAIIEIEPALVPALKSLVGAGDEASYRDGSLILPDTDQAAADAARVDAPTRALEMRQASALKTVDERAEAARLSFITPGSGQAMVYQRKVQEADRVLSGAEPLTRASFPLLAADIGIDVPDTGDEAADLATAANAVKVQEAAWLTAAAAIEVMRRSAKRDIATAGDMAGVAAVLAALTWPEPPAA